MDDDDRPGYLMDYLYTFAKQHGNDGMFTSEDFYQMDSIQELQAEFMEKVLAIAGFVEGR